MDAVLVSLLMFAIFAFAVVVVVRVVRWALGR